MSTAILFCTFLSLVLRGVRAILGGDATHCGVCLCVWRARRFLRKVDSYEKYAVFAWVTASNAKFLLLTERQDAESARQFFSDVHELYLKVLMNPFYDPGSKIEYPAFCTRVRKLAQRHLGVSYRA